MVRQCYLVRNSQTVFLSGCIILHFYQQWTPSVFGVLSALDYVHSNRDVLIVVLIFSHLIYIMLSIFPNACHLCIFFDKIRHHLFIFILDSLSFKCPLYILDSNSLSDMHFCHIFSEPVTWFFIIFFLKFFNFFLNFLLVGG